MPTSEPLKFPSASGLPVTHWFSSRGSVVVRGQTTEVFVGGTLIGSYAEGEQLERNAILVQLAADPRCHLGRLAEAFDMSTERLRQLRREYEAGESRPFGRARTAAHAVCASARSPTSRRRSTRASHRPLLTPR